MFPISISSVSMSIAAALSQTAPVAQPVEPLWRIVLRDFPLDPAAITLYVIVAISIGLVWWGHRRSRAGGGSAVAGDHTPAETGEPQAEVSGYEGDGRKRPRPAGRAAPGLRRGGTGI